MSDRLELQETAEAVRQILRKQKLLDRVLYIAHTTYGKSVEELAAQCGRNPQDVQRRITYVQKLLIKTVSG